MKDAHPDPALELPKNQREDHELQQLKNSEDVQKMRSLLQDGEIVESLILCFHEQSDGVLVATNLRLLFVDQKFITSKVVSYDYSEIAALVYANHLVTLDITLAHKSGSLTITKVDKDHGKRFISLLGTRIGQDYTVDQNSKRVFSHRGDTLELEDLPSQKEDA